MEDQKKEINNMPLFRKIGYGVGDAGSNFCWTFVASFIMIYCTNTLGVSAAVIGTVMMFSKVLDGITDVIMGRIIDATHSKMGKARFWYFVSSFPVAIFTFLLFNIPANFNENTKYIYFFIIYTLMGAVFYTMNNIAYASLTALCTKNPKDRVQMGSYRFIFATLAALFMSSVTMGLVEKFGGGQQGWRMVSFIYSILCLVLLLIPFFAVKEIPEEELREEDITEEQKDKIGFFKEILFLFKNKHFLLILGLYLVVTLSTGITSGMGVYFATYQLEDVSLLGTISLTSTLPVLLLLPCIPQFASKIGMRNAGIVGHAIGLAGGILIIFGGFNSSFTLILVGIMLKTAGTAPQLGIQNALIAEADEYSYLKFGHRMTGTIYSCASVGLKVGTGIGTALCGILLDFGGFVGTATTQTATAVSTINWSYLIGQAMVPALSLILFFFLKVEKENKELRVSKNLNQQN